jgi:hypothetical protein
MRINRQCVLEMWRVAYWHLISRVYPRLKNATQVSLRHLKWVQSWMRLGFARALSGRKVVGNARLLPLIIQLHRTANSSWSSKGIADILWNPQADCRVHKSTPHFPVWSTCQLNLIHSNMTVSSKRVFPLGFGTKPCKTSSSFPCIPHALPSSLFSSPEKHLKVPGGRN